MGERMISGPPVYTSFWGETAASKRLLDEYAELECQSQTIEFQGRTH